MGFYLPRADAERFRSVAPPPSDEEESSPFSRPRMAPPLSVPPPIDSGVEPDAAPNVAGWEPQPMGSQRPAFGQSYDEGFQPPSANIASGRGPSNPFPTLRRAYDVATGGPLPESLRPGSGASFRQQQQDANELLINAAVTGGVAGNVPTVAGEVGRVLRGNIGGTLGAVGADAARQGIADTLPDGGVKDAFNSEAAKAIAQVGGSIAGYGAGYGRVQPRTVDETQPILMRSGTGGDAAPPTIPAADDAVQALRDALSGEIELRKSGAIAEEIAQGRARQAGGIAGNLESTRARNASLDERITAGLSGARRPGGLRESLPQPLELTDAQKIALANQLEDALDSPFDKLNGLRSLNALIQGENVQPAQLKLLQRVFGEEIADLVTTSGRISPRAVLDDAANTRIAQAGKFSEKQIANLEERAVAQAKLADELQTKLNMNPTNSRLKRAVEQARQAGEYARTKADELLARRTQSLEGIPDDPLEALAQQKTVYTAMDKLREAERVQRAGGELSLDQQALLRTKEIVGRKLAIASEPAKSVINVVDELIRGDKAILSAIENDRPFLAGARAFITGDLPDSFLTAALHRRALTRSVLERQGVQGNIAQKMANILFDDQLKAHYGGTVPDEIKDTLAAAMRAGAGGSDAPGTISTFVQRYKNTQFGLGDFGVAGVQGLNAVRRGPIPLVAGMVNRTLAAMHLPHIATIADDADIDRLTQFAIDGLHMGTGPSSARPELGTLLSYGGKSGRFIDDKVLNRLSNAMNEFQFGKILGGIRELDHEGNLAIYKMLGRDITDPKVRAIAADNANTLTSFARSALNVDRRNLENALLTSPSMTRARVKSITDMAKLLAPNVSVEERINAATMIAGTYVVYATVGKWLNDQIGIADFEFDPSNPDFGVITSQFKDKQGRNIKIDVVPQDAVERAFAQSIRALTDPTIDDLQAQRAWERVLLGSGSIVTRGVAALGFRTGFEPGSGYKYGNLSGEGIRRTFNPLPPVTDNVGGSNTPLETGLTVLGVSNYPAESSGGSRRPRPTRAPRPSRPKRPER